MSGIEITWLANARAENFCHVDRSETIGADAPAKLGVLEELFPNNKELITHQVKKCGRCQKSCAVTLTTCNACDNELPEDTTTVANVFMGMMLGAERTAAGIPLTMSLRHETESVIVLDDIMALSPIHLNAIPTNVHIKDWRYLLKRPDDGLDVLEKLEQAGWAAVKKFIENDAFVQKYWSHIPKEKLESYLIQHCQYGCNWPPSQNQLHLQILCPPMFAGCYAQFVAGKHFQWQRWYSLDFIKTALESAMKEPLEDGWLDYDVETLLETFVMDRGVSYADEYHKVQEAVQEAQKALSDWRRADFTHIVSETRVVEKMDKAAADFDSPDAIADLQLKDKRALQNFGRPYADGKPTGVYYSFAKKPDDIEVW